MEAIRQEKFISPAMGSELIRKLGDTPWRLEHRSEMIWLINERVKGKPPEKGRPQEGSKFILMTHKFIQNFLLEITWAGLFDIDSRLQTCMEVLATRVVLELGCAFPSETTYVAMVAIVLLCRHRGPKGLPIHVDPVMALETLKSFKNIVKRLRTPPQKFLLGPAEYPSDPMDLKLLCPEVFEQAFPEGQGS